MFVTITAFVIGLLVGALTAVMWKKGEDAPSESRQGKYTFINPLLECEQANDSIRQKALLPFKNNINKLIKDQKDRGAIIDAAVYYRDLNNGPWFGVGEKEPYAPASLLKVITMMSILHAAESDKQLLQKKLRHVPRKTSFRPQIIVYPPLTLGTAYTIDDLLHRMIAFSDNDAAFLLGTFIGNESLNSLCRDLGVPVPDTSGEYLLSVKEYASFFRILFNASYLNREMSEKGLQYLSRSEYKNGIVAGVPPTVSVAHKFGEREFITPNGNATKQLHDCGIVYYPNHPYLLCIMTRGNASEELTRAIQDISHTVYSSVQKQYE